MKKYLFFLLFALTLLLGISILQYLQLHDHKLHIIFCDVGQGDGILIRTPQGKLLMIDGGPDEKMLGCMSRHLPFWQRTITLMFLSHPHADHLNGLLPVLERSQTKYFVSENLANKTAGYTALHDLLKEQRIPEKIAYAGDRIVLSGGVALQILSPSRELLTTTSPNGLIGESKEFANLITLLTYGKFSILFVGDSQAAQVEAAATFIHSPISVLQVPHHGSMTGLSEKALLLLRPQFAVISVGRNTYGHPSKYTLSLLEHAHIPTAMTLKAGDIELISDGITFTKNTK